MPRLVKPHARKPPPQHGSRALVTVAELREWQTHGIACVVLDVET